MKILELKKLIKNIPDDFEFHIDVQKKVEEKELEKRDYKYPFDSERCEVFKNDYDIGWPNKAFKINVEIKSL